MAILMLLLLLLLVKHHSKVFIQISRLGFGFPALLDLLAMYYIDSKILSFTIIESDHLHLLSIQINDIEPILFQLFYVMISAPIILNPAHPK